MVIKTETLDEVLKDCKTPADVDTLYSRLLKELGSERIIEFRRRLKKT